MVPGVVCWETFASGPCSPGRGHLCRRVKEQEVVVVGGLQRSAQSQRVPSPFFFKAFMDRGREKSCCAATHAEFLAVDELMGYGYRPSIDLQGRAASIPPRRAG